MTDRAQEPKFSVVAAGAGRGFSRHLFNFSGVILLAVGQVIVEQVRGVWVLSLVGEHDPSVEPSLMQRLERAFAAGSTVVVDLTEVEFMDSSVLRALAYGAEQAEQHPEHAIRIVAPRDGFPRRLLALTGVDKRVSISETRAVALAAVDQP